MTQRAIFSCAMDNSEAIVECGDRTVTITMDGDEIVLKGDLLYGMECRVRMKPRGGTQRDT